VQEETAADLGARPVLVLLTVTLPLSLPGIVAGAVLGWARALGEFGATITFVSAIPGETMTLPSAIHGFLQVPGGDSEALRLVLIAVAVSAVALVLSEALARAVARRVRG
jgi:molybdate transport system permease protein